MKLRWLRHTGFWYVLTQDVVEDKMTINNSLNFIHRNESNENKPQIAKFIVSHCEMVFFKNLMALLN